MSAIGNIFKSVFKGISNIATGVLTLNPGKILGGSVTLHQVCFTLRPLRQTR